MQCTLIESAVLLFLKYVMFSPFWVLYILVSIHELVFKTIREGLETLICNPVNVSQEEDPLTWFSL